MRIGITGAQSVGKTTLLNALRSEQMLKHYEFCDEVTRWVKRFGLEINEDGNDKTQELIMIKHVYNLHMFPNMITDRTVLDCLVYTKYLYNRSKVSLRVMDYIKMHYDKLINEYDIIFYIVPEFDIVSDGIRSDSKTFQNEIVKLFDVEINNMKRDTKSKVINIGGSVRDRVEKVLEKINV